MADALLADLGGMFRPKRVRHRPAAGDRHREADVIRWLHAADKRLYELVDGTLVEKDDERSMAAFVGTALMSRQISARRSFEANGDYGIVTRGGRGGQVHEGAGPHPGRVVLPLWDRFPGRAGAQAEPLAELWPRTSPSEVLSPVEHQAARLPASSRNTSWPSVRLVWVLDPDTRTPSASTTAPDAFDRSRLSRRHPRRRRRAAGVPAPPSPSVIRKTAAGRTGPAGQEEADPVADT